MTTEELKELIGMNVNEASKIVQIKGLKPQILSENAIVPAITIPENVVRILHNEEYVVTDVVTQKSIDERYSI